MFPRVYTSLHYTGTVVSVTATPRGEVLPDWYFFCYVLKIIIYVAYNLTYLYMKTWIMRGRKRLPAAGNLEKNTGSYGKSHDTLSRRIQSP